MTQFYKEYTKVFVAVDCIIFGFDGKNLQVLIGKRKMDPGRDEWSLYGGFVGQHESLERSCQPCHSRPDRHEKPIHQTGRSIRQYRP